MFNVLIQQRRTISQALQCLKSKTANILLKKIFMFKFI